MRRLVRILAVAGVAALAVGGAAAPAHAADQARIEFVLPTYLQGPSASELVVEVDPVLDVDGNPQHASGVTGTLTMTDGDAVVTLPLEDHGATASATFDVGALAPGAPTFSGSIDAAGVDGSYPFSDAEDAPDLVSGPDGATVAGGYAMAAAHRELWGCDGVQYHRSNATCIATKPRSGTETWQKGFRLAFHWQPVRSAPDPDATCTIDPMLPLQVDGTARAPLMDIRVPGDWSTYGVPMTRDDLAGWIPGSSQMSWTLSCDDALVHDGSQRQSATDLVPDVPPTDPTGVSATADDGGLAVSTGGSAALGAAPLEGYAVDVVADDGTGVASLRLPAQSVTTVGAMHRMTASRVSHTFGGLPTGTYVVRVAAYNRVGASGSVASTPVRVVAKPLPKPLSAVRHATARRTGTTATVRWSAPSRTGVGVRGYTVTLLRGSHVVRTVRAGASARRTAIHGLHRRTAYRVVVAVVAKDGRTVRTAVRISG